MIVTIEKSSRELWCGDEPTYTLLVDGVVKVAGESMQVCSNIQEALEFNLSAGFSECAEVADVIRRGLPRATLPLGGGQ